MFLAAAISAGCYYCMWSGFGVNKKLDSAGNTRMVFFGHFVDRIFSMPLVLYSLCMVANAEMGEIVLLLGLDLRRTGLRGARLASSSILMPRLLRTAGLVSPDSVVAGGFATGTGSAGGAGGGVVHLWLALVFLTKRVRLARAVGRRAARRGTVSA